MTDPTPFPGEPTEPAGTVETAPGGSRRGVVVGGIAAALAVVAGAAVWATTTLSGGGTQPDEVVPRSTFAYLKVDLDPAAGQKLAARSFFEKFPSLKDKTGNTDTVFDDLLAEVIDDEDLDYERDVRPWFDRRAAIAAFPGKGGVPHVVVALRSKDDDDARAALDRAVARAKAGGDDAAYRLAKGYAVVGQEAGVAEAVRLAAGESLRQNETYRADVDRLDGDQVAVAWADLGATFDAVKGEIPFAGLLPGLVTDQVKGRIVAGLHLTADYAELQGLALGVDPKTLDQPSDQSLLTGLPEGTVAALSLNGARSALGEGVNGFGLDVFLRQYLAGTGLSATGDIFPLLSDQTVLAAGAVDRIDSSRVGLLTKPSDTAKAARTAAKVTALLDMFGAPARAEVGENAFVLATPEDYAAELAAGGELGKKPLFTKAVGDLSGASAALYLDLSELRGLAPWLLGEDASGLTALGAVAGRDGNDGFFRVRAVAG